MSARSTAPGSTTLHPQAQATLDFWFGLERPGMKHDALVRAALGRRYEQAAAGEHDGWCGQALGRLALIVLVDQVPRHLYRTDARAFATDLKAQHLAAAFFSGAAHWDAMVPLQRFYAALPWLHAEDVQRQQAVNPVMHQCAAAVPDLDFMGRIADLYLETITRFGCFPHRHTLRGVAPSPEEAEYLEQVWFPRRRRVVPDSPQK